MLRCRTGEEACRRKRRRESRSSLVLAYKEGSLDVVYLWLLRKETGTGRGAERLCHGILSKE